ncbi:hypothetical protein VTI28DRAFT_7611 [Corynascus sepedonium]
MSPPLTLASSRNTSKDATADEAKNLKKYRPNKAGTGISHGTKRSSKSVSQSRLGTKRRPKRPLQLFEDVTSSLPPTQIIGESQPLGHDSQIAKLDQPAEMVNMSTGQDCIVGPHDDMSQWGPQASPPANILGIAISDDEQTTKMAPETEHGAPPHPVVEQSERPGISYVFSPHTVARRTLFHDIHNSSDSEE